MLSNKKFLLIESIIMIIILVLVLLSNKSLFSLYENELLKNDAYIVNSLIDKYPDKKDDIIKIIVSSNKDFSTDNIDRYGITKDTLKYISDYDDFKEKVYLSNIVVISISLIMMLSLFIYKSYRDNKKIKDISNYLSLILNDNYCMDIRDFDEGALSHLKNDIYKVTVKLKEQHEISLSDKKNLEETLSDISHQLKTPLTSMYVINDLLATDIDDSIKKEMLVKNHNQLERIEWLVSSLLKISRLDSGTESLIMKKVKVKSLIDKAIDPLSIPIELKKINVIVSCPKSLSLYVDANWTVEAFLNIIKNAYEHTSHNGKIEIIATDNPIYNEIVISDNGCGISKDDINHIFERFYKGKERSESIGIGLNMTKKIIDLQNGEITVKSEVGKGTSFIVKFYKNII